MGVYNAESTLVWLQWRRRSGYPPAEDIEPALGAGTTGGDSVRNRSGDVSGCPAAFAGMQSLLSPKRDQNLGWATVFSTASQLGVWP